ncbi:MAG: hypothetical protein KatS3mg007_1265 [Thermoanaerobaculum sp.]|nr:MAG: hypothetical protein KatS3mg007_1265 [Thermoanaerobaculum sp.]
MRRPIGWRVLLILLFAVALGSWHAEAAEYDDCDANFIAFVGASAYQFSPYAPGPLGTVRLYSVLSYQRAAALGERGDVRWKLEIRSPEGAVVREAEGAGRLEESGQVLAEFVWDGKDQQGRIVPEGIYTYTFRAYFLADSHGKRFEKLEELASAPMVEEAMASTDEVVVNYTLPDTVAQQIRVSALATSCEVQQNVPLEAGFPYNFYYGSTHSHSNFSDGGQPTTSCSSGNAYGSGTFNPAAVFDFARYSAGLDYWVVNEHNHLINDSVSTNNPPVTEAKVKQRYQDGRAAAAAATVDGTFVALYGMEWGVTTNTDQGHVTLLETPVLFGWESCSNCNGPNPECTPGTDCYFDVFTPKRYGYLTLYQRSVENPSPVGPLGIFCHPGTGNFDNYAFDANADAAIQGIAVRSGLAFATSTTCSDANVATTDYTPRWREALNKGFHLGPTADHDAHCNNYGIALPNRTVYLLPNQTAPVLTKQALLLAHKQRHFFATEDPNAQLVFATGDGAHIMGDIFSVGSSVTLRAAVYDPAGETLSRIELWRGQVGAGTLTAPYLTWSNQDSFTVTESFTSGTYYYFVHAVQADGHDLWSSPMWITFGGASCSDSDNPTVAVVSPSGGATVSGTVTIRVQASDATCGLSRVELSINGGPWSQASYNPASGYYELAWNTGDTACSGSATLQARATDASSPAHTTNSASVQVTIAPADSTAPSVSIVAPAAGSVISCQDTVIKVSASDASGVAGVEVQVDGGAWTPASFNAATGYWELTWASSAASSGTHTIAARATDTSCAANVGSASPVSVTVNNACGLDVSNYRLVQINASFTYTIPAGTRIADGGYLVIARNASKATFEAFWGVTLPSNVTFINAGGAFPVINGDEQFTLYDAAGTRLDGRTIKMPTGGGYTVQRKDPCLAAGKSTSWTISAASLATPGTGAGPGCGKGLVINEFADPAGSGEYVYEFIELHYDR